MFETHPNSPVVGLPCFLLTLKNHSDFPVTHPARANNEEPQTAKEMKRGKKQKNKVTRLLHEVDVSQSFLAEPPPLNLVQRGNISEAPDVTAVTLQRHINERHINSKQHFDRNPLHPLASLFYKDSIAFDTFC